MFVVVCLLGIALVFLYLVISPRPLILLLRKKLSGEADLKYPPDYEEDGSVLVRTDLVYRSESGRNRYDLYLPQKGKKKAPVIIWIHGGGFIAGGKGGVKNWGMMLAREGYAVVAPDYEYAPEAVYPNQPRQMQELIGELERQEKEGMPIDMHCVCLAGDSAGAHMAAQCALAVANPRFAQEAKIKPELPLENLKAVLLYCGPYNVESVLDTDNMAGRFVMGKIGWGLFGTHNWRKSSLLKTTVIKDYITPDFPPVFLTDGNTGSFERDGRELVKHLKACEVKVSELFFEASAGEIGHEFQYDLSGTAGRSCYQKTLEFLADVIN